MNKYKKANSYFVEHPRTPASEMFEMFFLGKFRKNLFFSNSKLNIAWEYLQEIKRSENLEVLEKTNFLSKVCYIIDIF